MLEGQSELDWRRQTTSTSARMKISRYYFIASLNSKSPIKLRSTKSKARRDADQNFRYYLILLASLLTCGGHACRSISFPAAVLGPIPLSFARTGSQGRPQIQIHSFALLCSCRLASISRQSTLRQLSVSSRVMPKHTSTDSHARNHLGCFVVVFNLRPGTTISTAYSPAVYHTTEKVQEGPSS